MTPPRRLPRQNNPSQPPFSSRISRICAAAAAAAVVVIVDDARAFSFHGYSFSSSPPSRSMQISSGLLGAVNVEEIPSSLDDLVGESADESIAAASALSEASDREKAFDEVVNGRYACTRFRRHAERATSGGDDPPSNPSSSPSASLSSPAAVSRSAECLALSQRAPSGFNVQPYRVVLVHSPQAKEALARYCIGRNADRVRDSDCTAVFLADREIGRDGRRFAEFLKGTMEAEATTEESSGETSRQTKSRARRSLDSRALLKIRGLVLLFSSGYPLPRFLASPISLFVRAVFGIASFVTRRRRFAAVLPMLPTLSSAETWSQKNTMLTAMTYMLACTSRGLASCPMEGFNAGGVRVALGIPRRFGIPMIVSVGTPYHRVDGGGEDLDKEADDVGMSHGAPGGGGEDASPRYSFGEVVFGDTFGGQLLATK